MAVSSNELKKAMETLGISDIHIEKDKAKKIYKQLLLKWHPDSCPAGEERFFTEISAKINSAYEIIEQAYSEGLMGPDAKASYSNSNNTSSSAPENTYSSNDNKSSTEYTTKSSNTADNAKDTEKHSKTTNYSPSDYFDSPDGFDIIYYRTRGLNIIFLTVCTIYIIKAILYSPMSDIYIEKSVINLISAIALYYAIYWFCKCFWACDAAFILPGIIAFIIYRAVTAASMYVYNKIGASNEWFAMLLFIIAFFTVEYFIHIRKILLTFGRTIKVRTSTKFFSCFMLLEYAIMFFFGLYSVALVHKYEAVRNIIIPPWY